MGGATLTLAHLAREIANDVRGAAHSLDEVGETAYAIDVGEQHALLLLFQSLPTRAKAGSRQER